MQNVNNILTIRHFSAIQWIVERIKEMIFRVIDFVPIWMVKKLPLWVLKPIPNILSLLRPILQLFAVWVFFQGDSLLYVILSFLISCVAAITDYYDGSIARLIKDKYPNCGITKSGEIIDPTADKFMVILSAFINPYFLIALLPEIFSTVSAYYIREKMKKHVITRLSKIATFFQFLFVMTAFFTARYSPLAEIWAGLVVTCSCLRFFSYVYAIEKATNEKPAVAIAKAA